MRSVTDSWSLARRASIISSRDPSEGGRTLETPILADCHLTIPDGEKVGGGSFRIARKMEWGAGM